MTKDIEVKEVILSNLTIRGDGNENPYRRIFQVFEKDGTLIAEKDPLTFGNSYILPQIKKYIEEVTMKVALLNNDNASQESITRCIEDGFVKVLDLFGT